MCLKIRCDGECEKFCKIFWEINKALEKIATTTRMTVALFDHESVVLDFRNQDVFKH